MPVVCIVYASVVIKVEDAGAVYFQYLRLSCAETGPKKDNNRSP